VKHLDGRAEKGGPRKVPRLPPLKPTTVLLFLIATPNIMSESVAVWHSCVCVTMAYKKLLFDISTRSNFTIHNFWINTDHFKSYISKQLVLIRATNAVAVGFAK